MNDKREHLLKGKIASLMFELTVPGIIGMLVISLYVFVDAIFVGRYAGKTALGSISLAYTFTLLNNGIAVLVGIGSASVLSRAIGRQDQKTVDAVMGNVFILTLLMSLAVTAFGIIFAPFLFKMVGAEGEMLHLGVRYLRIIYVGSIFVNFGQAANMVIRGEGRMAFAMTLMGISAVLNIALDALFVIVFKKGLEGAAAATVISEIVLGGATFVYFLRFSKTVRFTSFGLEKSIVKDTLSVGVSAMFMQVLTLVQQSVMYSLLKKYGGDDQVVLMGAFFRYIMLAFIPLWGISQGFQPFAGTNFGAGEFLRVKKGALLFSGFALSLAVLFWAVFLLFPERIMGLFIKNADLVKMGKFNALLAISVFPLNALMIINVTLFQSIGKAKPAGFMVMARQLFLYVPAALILPRFFGARGIWLATPIVDALVSLMSIIIVIGIFRRELSQTGKRESE
ncbi:MAG: MATE family efflux transporter [Treponema sp.]